MGDAIDGAGEGFGEAFHDISEAAVFLGGDAGDGFHGSGSSTASPVTWGLFPKRGER